MNTFLYALELNIALRRWDATRLRELVEVAELDLARGVLIGEEPGEAWGAFAEFANNVAHREKVERFEFLVSAVENPFTHSVLLARVASKGRAPALRALLAVGADETSLSEPQKKWLHSVFGSTWRVDGI
jgi:hypothetical protein